VTYYSTKFSTGFYPLANHANSPVVKYIVIVRVQFLKHYECSKLSNFMSTFALSKAAPLYSCGTTSSSAMHNYSGTSTSQQDYSVKSPHHYWLRSTTPSVSPLELQSDANKGPVVDHAFNTTSDLCNTHWQNTLGVAREVNRLNCILESFTRDVRGKISISGAFLTDIHCVS
jgi:hypothetical protein